MGSIRGLDDYIMGTHIRAAELVHHRCSVCGKEKDLEMIFDMGGWFYSPESEDEAFCCDVQMENYENI